MTISRRAILKLTGAASATLLISGAMDATTAAEAKGRGALKGTSTHWEPAGWGGGGFYWATVFDPTRNGVIYMSGDVAGIYKSDDHGQHWRMINNGLPGYAVYALAVDTHSQTVFAGTEQGLCKSTNGGEHWTLLPNTGPDELHLTSERGRSTDNIAVDPVDGNVIYVGSPSGIICKSSDGGETWKQVYGPTVKYVPANVMQLQMGGQTGQAFGGFWCPLRSPSTIKAADCRGFEFYLKADGTMVPGKVVVSVTTRDGTRYNTSKDLTNIFSGKVWKKVFLKSDDFILDANSAKTRTRAPSTPDWPKVNRFDLVCVNGLDNEATVQLKKFDFVLHSSAGAAADHLVAKDFRRDKVLYTYGNAKISVSHHGKVKMGGTIQSVTVSSKNPELILAATHGHGVLMSQDAGQTWRELGTPQHAKGVAVAPSDENVMYGAFGRDGIYKSTNRGQTWTKCSDGIESSVLRVVISPTRSDHVYAIGNNGWNGVYYSSQDGGKTWHGLSQATVDYATSPVNGPATGTGKLGLSTLTDLALNPHNPNEMFISGNWNSFYSGDGGKTWVVAVSGANISCIYDIRFHGSRVYVGVMDEGSLVSENDGAHWRRLWPLEYSQQISGHDWRLAISDGQMPGQDHIVATVSPWTGKPSLVLVSDDGGKTHRVVTEGLPDYVPTVDTMWGRGYARALASDPHNPKTLYLGIDGAPSNGHNGGGIFKSEDGGNSWRQLAHQPGDREMFFGLAVDPTDSRRLYWGCCGKGGGLWRSDDGGESWQHVFDQETYVFNIFVTSDGTLYCPGKNLWRSTDHGHTWTQLTHFQQNWTIIGLADNPDNKNMFWISATTWDSSSMGGVFQTTDGGRTWQEITGDLPYRKPLILRYDPAKRQLWAGGVGLSKTSV